MTQVLRAPRFVVAVLCFAALLTGALVAAERSARAMADAGTAFLNSLTPEQRSRATFAFTSDQRTRWNFIPTEAFPRQGLLVGDMTDAQRTAAHNR